MLSMSLPTRERGLKYIQARPTCWRLQVAPHAGAWIEMTKEYPQRRQDVVAPHAGAWIEITSLSLSDSVIAESLPTRERGLKLKKNRKKIKKGVSLPTRERGLKCPGIPDSACPGMVAPHAGAWIEILGQPHLLLRTIQVAPHAGAWIEMPCPPTSTVVCSSRSPRGSVD